MERPGCFNNSPILVEAVRVFVVDCGTRLKQIMLPGPFIVPRHEHSIEMHSSLHMVGNRMPVGSRFVLFLSIHRKSTDAGMKMTGGDR